MKPELWDIYDENGNATGKTTVRGKSPLKSGEYHLVVHIWIVSPDGRFLIQRRSNKKRLMPGEWAATGGAAIAGETSFEAASRELYEELGIKSDRRTLKRILRVKRRNSILDIWLIETDIERESLSLQPSEVSDAKWVSESELRSMIKTGRYHNYGNEYFKTVFEKINEHKEVLA